MKNTKGRASLLHFHTTHKLLILSHSTKHYQIMGKLVADQKKITLAELRFKYEILLLEALSLIATPKKHTNVLQHMMGYFKEQLSADEKSELLEIISDYHKGFIPLIVPVTLIRHYARKYRQTYLIEQVYLNPHPAELKLRNHV